MKRSDLAWPKFPKFIPRLIGTMKCWIGAYKTHPITSLKVIDRWLQDGTDAPAFLKMIEDVT